MSDKPFATGKCLCGAVNYSIKAEPVSMGQCHCKDCQRASGTGHMSIARFKREDVTISGQTTSYASVAESGNTNTRHFCPVCHFERIAKRRVANWRCPECRAIGLPGRLHVEQMSAA